MPHHEHPSQEETVDTVTEQKCSSHYDPLSQAKYANEVSDSMSDDSPAQYGQRSQGETTVGEQNQGQVSGLSNTNNEQLSERTCLTEQKFSSTTDRQGLCTSKDDGSGCTSRNLDTHHGHLCQEKTTASETADSSNTDAKVKIMSTKEVSDSASRDLDTHNYQSSQVEATVSDHSFSISEPRDEEMSVNVLVDSAPLEPNLAPGDQGPHHGQPCKKTGILLSGSPTCDVTTHSDKPFHQMTTDTLFPERQDQSRPTNDVSPSAPHDFIANNDQSPQMKTTVNESVSAALPPATSVSSNSVPCDLNIHNDQSDQKKTTAIKKKRTSTPHHKRRINNVYPSRQRRLAAVPVDGQLLKPEIFSCGILDFSPPSKLGLECVLPPKPLNPEPQTPTKVKSEYPSLFKESPSIQRLPPRYKCKPKSRTLKLRHSCSPKKNASPLILGQVSSSTAETVSTPAIAMTLDFTKTPASPSKQDFSNVGKSYDIEPVCPPNSVPKKGALISTESEIIGIQNYFDTIDKSLDENHENEWEKKLQDILEFATGAANDSTQQFTHAGKEYDMGPIAPQIAVPKTCTLSRMESETASIQHDLDTVDASLEDYPENEWETKLQSELDCATGVANDSNFLSEEDSDADEAKPTSLQEAVQRLMADQDTNKVDRVTLSLDTCGIVLKDPAEPFKEPFNVTAPISPPTAVLKTSELSRMESETKSIQNDFKFDTVDVSLDDYPVNEWETKLQDVLDFATGVAKDSYILLEEDSDAEHTFLQGAVQHLMTDLGEDANKDDMVTLSVDTCGTVLKDPTKEPFRIIANDARKERPGITTLDLQREISDVLLKNPWEEHFGCTMEEPQEEVLDVLEEALEREHPGFTTGDLQKTLCDVQVKDQPVKPFEVTAKDSQDKSSAVRTKDSRGEVPNNRTENQRESPFDVISRLVEENISVGFKMCTAEDLTGGAIKDSKRTQYQVKMYDPSDVSSDESVTSFKTTGTTDEMSQITENFDALQIYVETSARRRRKVCDDELISRIGCIFQAFNLNYDLTPRFNKCPSEHDVIFGTVQQTTSDVLEVIDDLTLVLVAKGVYRITSGYLQYDIPVF